jgi:prepilin-type N-terminal cleavage/methylation domain-containing protein
VGATAAFTLIELLAVIAIITALMLFSPPRSPASNQPAM